MSSSITVAAAESAKRPRAEAKDDNDNDDDNTTTTATTPQPKRRRVADSARVRAVRACQRCRRLKEKCDGRQPCQRCDRSGRDCEFAPVGVPASHPASSATARNAVPRTSTTTTRHRPTQSDTTHANPREAGLIVAAENARSEERTKCLERLVQHLLGDVPLDLPNLRRMADKAGRRSESDNGSTMGGSDDLGDLTLEDEHFTVKTLSQNTAREYNGSPEGFSVLICHNAAQTTRANFHTGTFRKSCDGD